MSSPQAAGTRSAGSIASALMLAALLVVMLTAAAPATAAAVKVVGGDTQLTIPKAQVLALTANERRRSTGPSRLVPLPVGARPELVVRPSHRLREHVRLRHQEGRLPPRRQAALRQRADRAGICSSAVCEWSSRTRGPSPCRRPSARLPPLGPSCSRPRILPGYIEARQDHHDRRHPVQAHGRRRSGAQAGARRGSPHHDAVRRRRPAVQDQVEQRLPPPRLDFQRREAPPRARLPEAAGRRARSPRGSRGPRRSTRARRRCACRAACATARRGARRGWARGSSGSTRPWS